MTPTNDIRRLKKNLADELDGAAVYDTLADAESVGARREIFRELAAAEREHAGIWRQKLVAAGVELGPHRASIKTRLLRALVRLFGASFVLQTVAAAEYADQNKYASQPDAAHMSAEERGHAAVVNAVVNNSTSQPKGAQIAAAESWHRGVTSGNDLRAAVLGANDGLVSNFCLLMGVAGAGSSNKVILLTGLAGLIAGSCSMALGEWLSVTNARELAQTQIAKEADEIEHSPESEEKELALIYRAKGLDLDAAKTVAAQMMQDKDKALDTLTREELGLDPAQLGGNPWSAAGASFLLFSLGAVIPAMPFIWTQGSIAIVQCIGFGCFALAAIGVFTSLFNGRGAAFSAARQVAVGLVAAAFTFAVGHLLGVTMS